MSAANTARNADIVACIDTGSTFQQMADKYGITRQRAHQAAHCGGIMVIEL